VLKKLAAFGATLVVMAGLAVGMASPASAVSYTCFGYTGNFASPTAYPTYQYVNWPTGPDNCFGISPGRHIWSTSSGHPWSQIPGGGLADGLSGYLESVGSGFYGKTVQVWIAASGNYYCQTWWSDTGWESFWTLCNSGIAPN